MVPERHSALISRVFLPTCAAQGRGPSWHDDEVLPHGFGGVDSELHRSTGVIAGSNRRSAAPRSYLRVRFCLDDRALVWRWQGWWLVFRFCSWGKSDAVNAIFIGTPPPNLRGWCGLNLPNFYFDLQPNRSTFAGDNRGEKSFTTAPPSSSPSCVTPRGWRWRCGSARLRTVGAAIGPRCCMCWGNASPGRLNEEANRARAVG
jgi:hypothetical protein